MIYSKKETDSFFKASIQESPSDAANFALANVCSMLVEGFAEPLKMTHERMRYYFFGEVFPQIRKSPCSIPSEDIETFLMSADNGMKKQDKYVFLQMALLACSSAARCLNDTENERQAWGFALDAGYWSGVLSGLFARKDAESHGVRENSRKASLARHAENHASAEDIMNWYFENHKKYTSLDAAALDATKITPLKFRAARKHIGVAEKAIKSEEAACARRAERNTSKQSV